MPCKKDSKGGVDDGMIIHDPYICELIEALQDAGVFIRKYSQLEINRYELWIFMDNSFVLTIDRNASYKARAKRNERKAKETFETYSFFLPINNMLWYLKEYMDRLLPDYCVSIPNIVWDNNNLGHIGFRTEKNLSVFTGMMDGKMMLSYYSGNRGNNLMKTQDAIDPCCELNVEMKRVAMKMFRCAYLNGINPASRDRKKYDILGILEDEGFRSESIDAGEYGEEISMTDGRLIAFICVVYMYEGRQDEVSVRIDAGEHDTYWKRFVRASTNTIRKELMQAIKMLRKRNNG